MNASLILAAYDGLPDLALQELAHGANPDFVDERGFTPLTWSCFRSAVAPEVFDVLCILLAHGADPNLATASGIRPLNWASRIGSGKAVAALLDAGANPNLTGDDVTPLMDAAQEGNVEVVRLLLTAGADRRIASSRGGFTAADYARSGGHHSLALELEEDAIDDV